MVASCDLSHSASMVIVKDWINTLPKLLLLIKITKDNGGKLWSVSPLRQHGHREGLDKHLAQEAQDRRLEVQQRLLCKFPIYQHICQY